MKIHYNLLKMNKWCIMVNKETVFSNVADITIEFGNIDLKSTYVVVFKDSANKEYKAVLTEGKCKLPKEITPTQTVNITLYLTENALIKDKYDCEPLMVADFNARAKTVWELYPDLRNFRQTYLKFIEDYQKSLVDIETIKKDFAQQKAEITDRNLLVDNLINTLETALNTTITAINVLSERVEFIEKNYNPLEV